MSKFLDTQIVPKLKKLSDYWLPKTLIEVKGDGFRYSQYKDNDYQEVPSLPETHSIFEQKILLVPDAISFFNLRQFSVESIPRQGLMEAVELDLARWSPWQEEVGFYFWPKRAGDQWRVAVWVWQRSDLEAITANLKTNPTHIIPARAWKIASLNADQTDFVHIDSNGGGSWTYTEVREDFATLRIATIRNEPDARRFRAALGSETSLIYVDGQIDNASLPWEQPTDFSISRYSQPDPSALSAARQPGINDWSDPFVWAKPTGAILALYVFWLLGSAMVMLKQGQEVQEYSTQASLVSIEVLDARAEVERINTLLKNVDLMRANQFNLESLLASLTTGLPKNAWLEHMEYRGDEGGWLEITGKSEQSSTLAAVLEQMPEVEHAMFLTEIRKDKITGLEPFKIRLKLATGDR